MFIGTYEHTLDDKGRISVPGRYRELLAAVGSGPLVVTKNYDPGCRCLIAFPTSEWQAFAERLYSTSHVDPNILRLQRMVVAGAAECPIDKQGRILLPAPLREHADLRKEVIWAGLGRRVELWEKGRWEEEAARNRDQLAEINRALMVREAREA